MQAPNNMFDWYAQMIAYLLGTGRPDYALTSALAALLDRPDMQWPVCAWTDPSEEPHVLAVEREQRVIHAGMVDGRPAATAYRLDQVQSVSAAELFAPSPVTPHKRERGVKQWRVELANGSCLEPRVESAGDQERKMRLVMLSLLRPMHASTVSPAAVKPGAVGFVGMTFDGG